MPADYPDFPHHTQVAAYFDAYVDRFGLRERITFETGVERAERVDGGWSVQLESGEQRDYDALLVANGHHWDPRWPEPAFPGWTTFEGVQMHSHDYLGDDPALFAGKRVVVLGHGQLGDGHRGRGDPERRARVPGRAPRRLDRAQVRLRAPARPVRDRAAGPARGPPALLPDDAARRGRLDGALRAAEARPPAAGGAPDDLRQDLHAAHARRHHAQAEHRAADRATASSSPTAARNTSTWSIYGTGYKVRFPFFDPALVAAPDNDLPLYRRVFHPDAAGAVLHRAAAAAGRDDAARRGPVRVGLRPPDRPLRAAAERRAAERHRARARGDAQALRRLQAPHDAGRLRRLPVRAGARARPRRERA